MAKETADQLLYTLLRSDPAAGLNAVMAQYVGLVWAVVAGRLSGGTREDVEECVSDVFQAFYEQRDLFDPEKGSIRAYLCVMAKRAAIGRYRQLSNPLRQTVSLELLDSAVSDGTAIFDGAAVLDGAAEAAEEQELRGQLIRAVRALGEPDHEIFIRKFYLGQTTKQIAREMELRPNTVDKKVSRGYDKLRKILEGAIAL